MQNPRRSVYRGFSHARRSPPPPRKIAETTIMRKKQHRCKECHRTRVVNEDGICWPCFHGEPRQRAGRRVECMGCGKPHDRRFARCWECYVRSVRFPERKVVSDGPMEPGIHGACRWCGGPVPPQSYAAYCSQRCRSQERARQKSIKRAQDALMAYWPEWERKQREKAALGLSSVRYCGMAWRPLYQSDLLHEQRTAEASRADAGNAWGVFQRDRSHRQSPRLRTDGEQVSSSGR